MHIHAYTCIDHSAGSMAPAHTRPVGCLQQYMGSIVGTDNRLGSTKKRWANVAETAMNGGPCACARLGLVGRRHACHQRPLRRQPVSMWLCWPPSRVVVLACWRVVVSSCLGERGYEDSLRCTCDATRRQARAASVYGQAERRSPGTGGCALHSQVPVGPAALCCCVSLSSRALALLPCIDIHLHIPPKPSVHDSGAWLLPAVIVVVVAVVVAAIFLLFLVLVLLPTLALLLVTYMSAQYHLICELKSCGHTHA